MDPFSVESGVDVARKYRFVADPSMSKRAAGDALTIALLSLHYPPSIGGTSTFARALVEGISSRGHDVTVAVRHGEAEAASGAYRLVRHPSFRELIRLARRADVVHMNGFWLAGAVAAKFVGTPLVWTHHEYDTRCPIGLASYQGEFTSFSPGRCVRCMVDRDLARHIPKRFAMVPVRRLIAHLAEANVAPSVHMGRSLGLPRSEILHYGLTRHSRGSLPREANVARFVFAGRLIPEKGCDVLVEAAAECRRRGNEFLVEIYGDGPERMTLERGAHALGVQDIVLFKGAALQEEVAQNVAGARAVVVPSVWQENSPLVAIESMSLGVAVIGARSGGLPETIGGGGLVVEQRDPIALADALERLVQDPDLAERLGRLAWTRFRSEYTLRAAAETHERLYRRVAGGVAGGVTPMITQQGLTGSPLTEPLTLRLRCPACFMTLQKSSRALRCAGCGANYAIEGVVPILTRITSSEPPVLHSSGSAGDAQFLIRNLLARETKRAVSGWRGTVLDIGCGDKRYANAASIRWIGLDIVPGVDVDVVASADALPFEDATFDHVLMSQVLEHVPDPATVLAEAYRVLRPSGTICVSAPQAWPVHGAPHDYFRFTEFGLRHLLNETGFRDIDVRRCAGSLFALTQFLLLAFAPKRELPAWASRAFTQFVLALDERLSRNGDNTLGNIAVGTRA